MASRRDVLCGHAAVAVLTFLLEWEFETWPIAFPEGTQFGGIRRVAECCCDMDWWSNVRKSSVEGVISMDGQGRRAITFIRCRNGGHG